MKPRILKALAAMILLVTVGFAAIVAVSHMPVEVTLAPGHCTTKPIGPYGITSGPLPCRFAAYPFPSDDGWVVIGAGGEVQEQCLKIPADALRKGALSVSWSSRLLFQLPARCHDSYAVYHPGQQPIVDFGRLAHLFGGPSSATEQVASRATNLGRPRK